MRLLNTEFSDLMVLFNLFFNHYHANTGSQSGHGALSLLHNDLNVLYGHECADISVVSVSWVAVLPLSQCGVAALPAGRIDVVVVDVLLGGRGGRRAAAAGLAHLHLLGLLGVRHRGAVGQVGVVGVGGGVQLRSHLLLLLLLPPLLLLLLLLARQGQSQDLITYRQPARELADLLGLFQRFWEKE